MDTTQQPWHSLRSGTAHKLLDRLDSLDLQFDLMRLDPNTRLNRHTHPKFEWVYVLRGTISDERGTFSVGHFFKNEPNSTHTAFTGADGVELLVVWCGRVTPVNV